MRKLILALLIFGICILPCEAGMWGMTKPPLGSQINWSHPLSRGLVGCWLMNEGGGIMIKDLCNITNGTKGSAVNWGASRNGSHLKFSNVANSKVTFSSTSAVNRKPCSYRVIFYTNALATTNQGIVTTTDGADEGFVVDYNWITASKIEVRIFRTANVDNIIADNNLTSGFHDILWTHDGTNTYLYIDGIKQIDSSTQVFTVGTIGTSILTLGRLFHNTDNYRLNGGISLFQMWNRPLTPSEISQLYQEPYCFIQQPKSWWKTAVTIGTRRFRQWLNSFDTNQRF